MIFFAMQEILVFYNQTYQAEIAPRGYQRGTSNGCIIWLSKPSPAH